MTPGYPRANDRLFAVYVSPWKIVFYLIVSAAFVVGGYLIGLRPGARPDTFDLVMAGLTVGLFGLGVIVFGAQLINQVIARRPVVEFTAEGLRYRPSLLRRKETRIPWSQIASISVYRQRTGRATMSYLAIIPRSPQLDAALAQGAQLAAFSLLRGLQSALVPLNAAYLRVTPARCARLLAEIQAACASEIARYGVYVEPKVERMP